ncbi:MAG: hypothetical protein CL910_22005 [Deltaproteobacteria bacterium]|nr:hypothetical protein [Deltaproteobacteria bacterium]
MRMHLTWKRAVVGLALACLLATPALAGTAWKWTAEDGSVAFTDDRERIPERFRASAERTELGPLTSYSQLTPEDVEIRNEYAERLYARLERLRTLRSSLDAAEAARAHGAASPASGDPTGFEATVEVGGSTIRLPAVGGGDEPLIVEEVRSRPRGKLVTRHNTIVRRGEEILMIVRPAQDTQANVNDYYDERELEKGTFRERP